MASLEHLPHIFEHDWRVNGADEGAAAASSGLGLAIAKRILDLHGSMVRVQWECARGTRFDFLLPPAPRVGIGEFFGIRDTSVMT